MAEAGAEARGAEPEFEAIEARAQSGVQDLAVHKRSLEEELARKAWSGTKWHVHVCYGMERDETVRDGGWERIG